MRWIIGACMRLAVAVTAAAVLVLVVGVGALRHAPVETLPEFLPPQVQVQTEALGLSASEVEQFVTVPLEDEFNGLPFLDHLRSKSIPGLSAIELTFKPGTDIYQARQLVTERVAQGPAVVNVGTPPVMIQPLSGESRAMMIGLSSRSMSMIDLSTLARWRIRPRLLAVPGVANVTIWGQRDQQLQVLVDPSRLHQHGVTLTQVINTTGDAMWTSPLTFVEASSPGADGFVDMPNQRLSVQHILPINTPQDLAKVPVEEVKNGTGVRLGDVATVVTDHPAMRGDARLAHGPGFLLVVEKFPGADPATVDRGVRAAMADLAPGLHGVTVDTSVFRQGAYLDEALSDIAWLALAGLVLLTAWFGVCWRSWRVAVLALVAVVLPPVAAAYALYLRHTTLNLFTLAGLLVALGWVVDCAVRGVAAAFRGAGTDEPSADLSSRALRAARLTDALAAAARPLGISLVVLLVAAVPLAVVPGVGGSMARSVFVSYVPALLAAAVVAVTVVPGLAFLLLRGRAASAAERTLPFARWAEEQYARLAPRVQRRPRALYAGVGVCLLCALALVPQLVASDSLVPPWQDHELLVRWQGPPGTSLPAMERTTAAAEDGLRAVPGVRDVASDIGQALMGDQIKDVDSAQTWITVSGGADLDDTRESIRDVLDRFPGLQHTLLTYPQASLNAAPEEVRESGPALRVRLYGTDPAVMDAQARRIGAALSGVPGVRNTTVNAVPEEPAITIDTQLDKAAAYGLKPGDVRRATAVLIGGIPVGSYYQQQQIFDVAVWSVPTVRKNLADVQNLLLDTPDGRQVPLKDVASVAIRPTPTEIDHDQASRFVDITASVSGTDLAGTENRARAAVAALPQPAGYHAEVSSDLSQRQSGDRQLLVYALACLVAALLLFQAAFRSWTRAALLLCCVPLALSGGAVSGLVAGVHATAGTLLGFALVLAPAVRGGIGLIRRVQAREAEGAARAEAVERGSRETVLPVLATAVGLALALLPFAVAGDMPGLELLRPAALVGLGGLVTSTGVTLVLLPALYLRLPGRGAGAGPPPTAPTTAPSMPPSAPPSMPLPEPEDN